MGLSPIQNIANNPFMQAAAASQNASKNVGSVSAETGTIPGRNNQTLNPSEKTNTNSNIGSQINFGQIAQKFGQGGFKVGEIDFNANGQNSEALKRGLATTGERNSVFHNYNGKMGTSNQICIA